MGRGNLPSFDPAPDRMRRDAERATEVVDVGEPNAALEVATESSVFVVTEGDLERIAQSLVCGPRAVRRCGSRGLAGLRMRFRVETNSRLLTRSKRPQGACARRG